MVGFERVGPRSLSAGNPAVDQFGGGRIESPGPVRIAKSVPAERIAYGVGRRRGVPAAAYGLPTDVQTIVAPNLLLVRDDLDANPACVLTTTLFDRKLQLGQGNSAAKGISRDSATITVAAPLHTARRTL
ncbi:TAXI family TRAP transporter solute-binding subunit [Nocardia sp. R16R-3T]